MKLQKVIYAMFAVGALVLAAACDDSESYAELLTKQDHYVNNFLADQRVELEVPADTVFLTGEDAPYYRLDDDGTMYMQVLDPGTKGNMVAYDEQIYFRYTRWSLSAYSNGKLPNGAGNNITLNPTWFRYGNFQIQSSYNWGIGIQTPLSLLPVDCKVNIVIKAQNGVTDEASDVRPYLYQLTYERRQ